MSEVSLAVYQCGMGHTISLYFPLLNSLIQNINYELIITVINK